MRHMRRRSDMPDEDKVLRTQIFNIGYLVGKLKGLVEGRVKLPAQLPEGVYELEIEEVVELSDELHPKVLIAFKLGGMADVRAEQEAAQQGDSAEEEHGEGALQGERSDELVRPDTASERRADLDSESAEGPGGRTVRESVADPRD